jgi:pimeloyl-ACP methyl ester carboxylesterase
MGLALLAPYDDLASVGQRQMPYLPVSWLLRDRFTPALWLKDYRGQVMLLVAGADEIIPREFALRLHDGYAGPKRLQVIEGAGHNDVAEQPSIWWQEVLKFWQSQPRGTP